MTREGARRLWPFSNRSHSKPRTSLSEGLGGRNNALGIIRLTLASSVIFSHAFPLGGRGEDPMLRWSQGRENIGGIAVLGFFAISGYLITKSGANSDIMRYLWHRILRIFPAFWTVLLVGALIVGPAIWMLDGHSLADYAHTGSLSPVAYFTTNWNLTIGGYGIYDIFITTTPYGKLVGSSIFNGSLWTLTYEWTCYLIVGVFVLCGALTRAKLLVPLLTAGFFALMIVHTVNPIRLGELSPYFADQYHITLPLIFLCGACLATYSKRVPLNDWIGASCGVIAIITLFAGGFELLGYPAIAYFVLWLAARLPARLRKVGAENDYSYGIYVYGFLVEQVLAYFGVYKWGYLPYAVLTLLITVACAWASWHVVEKRALALKDRGPGRGIRYWVARVLRRKPGAGTKASTATAAAAASDTAASSPLAGSSVPSSTSTASAAIQPRPDRR